MRSRPDRILVWMCVLIAVNQLGFGGIVPVLALYSRSFGVSQSAIGVAIAVYGLARFLVAMPAGRLADGMGRRPALALGGLVTTAGNLLCAYAPSFAVLVGGRFVAGAGAALILIAGQIVLADITTPARRSWPAFPFCSSSSRPCTPGSSPAASSGAWLREWAARRPRPTRPTSRRPA